MNNMKKCTNLAKMQVKVEQQLLHVANTGAHVEASDSVTAVTF